MQTKPNDGSARRSLRRAIPSALALATLAIVAAACGGGPPSASVANLGSTSTTNPTSSTGTSGPSDGNGGGGGGGGTPSSGSGSTVGIGGVTVQFAQCMRSHGVPSFPDPNSQGQATFSGVNPGSASFQAAQRACAKYAPGGGKPPTAAQQQKALAQALKYSQCMRSHGISDFPDPQTSPGGGISLRIRAGVNSDLNPNNPQFVAAQKACQSLMLGGGHVQSGATS